jgi:hypothetical protein
MTKTLFDRLRPPPAEQKKQPHKNPTEELLEWLVVHWAQPTVSARDIHRSAPTFFRDKKMILDLTQELEKRGWLTPTPAHRHDSRTWKIARGLPLGDHTTLP